MENRYTAQGWLQELQIPIDSTTQGGVRKDFYYTAQESLVLLVLSVWEGEDLISSLPTGRPGSVTETPVAGHYQ